MVLSAVWTIVILLLPLIQALSLPLASTCSCSCPTKGSAKCPSRCSRCATTKTSCNCTTACGYWERCETDYCFLHMDHDNCWLGMGRAICSRSCSLMTSTCVECESGFFGQQCRNACPTGGPRDRICGGHGYCHDGVKGSGKCSCDDGFAGPRCQFSDRNTCNDNGEATNTGECKCNRGYTGEACQYNDYMTCSGHGRVDIEGKCHCKALWEGPHCGLCAGFSFMGGCVSSRLTTIAAVFITLVGVLSCGCLVWAVDSARRPTYRAAAHLKPTGTSYNTFGDASTDYRSAGSDVAGPGESVASYLSGDVASMRVPPDDPPSFAEGLGPEAKVMLNFSPSLATASPESASPLLVSAAASPFGAASPFAPPLPSMDALVAVEPMALLSPPYPPSKVLGEVEPFPSTATSVVATPRPDSPAEEPPPPLLHHPPSTAEPADSTSPPIISSNTTTQCWTNPPSPPSTPLSPPAN
eukprot:GGOE01042743.1.p1 GENE.GGOE01042743.1~~GGOE01042743.1.p1  ORF type:complete len:469 (-),score=60.04 GGOE01042743.1:100-1506(-)